MSIQAGAVGVLHCIMSSVTTPPAGIDLGQFPCKGFGVFQIQVNRSTFAGSRVLAVECVKSYPKRCSAGLLWPVQTQNCAISTLPGSREADGF